MSNEANIWNITRRQAISPVAKFHHVLGRGFKIQLLTLSQSESTILHASEIVSVIARVKIVKKNINEKRIYTKIDLYLFEHVSFPI